MPRMSIIKRSALFFAGAISSAILIQILFTTTSAPFKQTVLEDICMPSNAFQVNQDYAEIASFKASIKVPGDQEDVGRACCLICESMGDDCSSWTSHIVDGIGSCSMREALYDERSRPFFSIGKISGVKRKHMKKKTNSLIKGTCADTELMTPGKDYYQGDLISVSVTAGRGSKTAEECCNECAAQQGECVAYSVVVESGRCWLKSKIGMLKKNVHVISGVVGKDTSKPAPPPPPRRKRIEVLDISGVKSKHMEKKTDSLINCADTDLMTPGKDYFAGDLLSVLVTADRGSKTAEECCNECAAQQGECVAYSVVVKSGRCLLKSTIGKQEKNTRVISGVIGKDASKPASPLPPPRRGVT